MKVRRKVDVKKAIYNDSKDRKHNNLLNSISQVLCIIRKVGVVKILIISKKNLLVDHTLV